MLARGSILGPSLVESICRDDAPQITETRDQSRSSGHSDLAVSALEDLVGPGHADRHGGAEAESNHKETAVAGPRVGQGEGDCEEAGDLDTHGCGEEQGAVLVESVGNGCYQEDGTKVHLEWR